jgi:hypothetical protein
MGDKNNLKNYITPIFLDETKELLKQMRNGVYQICIQGNNGTGFPCRIPLSKDNYLPVFITSNNLINEDYLKQEENIPIQIKIGKEINKISISLKDKFYYTNKDYDITIVEIKQNIDNINTFLELDQNIFNDPKDYVGNSIYILNYQTSLGENKVAASIGKLIEINKDNNHDFNHFCFTTKESSGAPILNLSNNKIIGIHKSASKEQINIGSFLYYPLNEFIDEYNKRKNNKKEKKKIKGYGLKNFKILTNLFYSYECMNKNDLESCIDIGTNTTKFELSLKNDGTLEWPEKTTKLIFDKNSKIKGDEIILKPQKAGEELKYKVVFNNLEKLDQGEYKSYMRFQIKDDIFIGEKLILKIIVKEKEDPNSEMNNHMEEIEKLRKEYGLSEDQYTNKIIYDALEKSGFEIEQAFILLIQEN